MFSPIYNPWVDPVLRIGLLDHRRRSFGRDVYYDRQHYCRYETWWLFGKPVYQRVHGQSRFDPYDYGVTFPTPLKLFLSTKDSHGPSD